MIIDQGSIRIWEAPTAVDVGQTVEEFLERLGGPTWLCIPGDDRSRTRAITTLLHGNEPSGVRAIHEWIRSGKQPTVNLACFIGAVQAALKPPGFANRFLPGHQDLNRCFRPPFDGDEGTIAAELLQRLRSANPEALIDLHNTSGMGPAYTVSTQISPVHEALTTLFSHHLVLTDLRLNTLMEAMEDDFLTITVECGGAHSRQADAVATQGLFHYATADSIVVPTQQNPGVTVLKHPIRVELSQGLESRMRQHLFQPSTSRFEQTWILTTSESSRLARSSVGWVPVVSQP